ncbi:hypothetical protein ACMGE9_02540 [Macrococcus sp. EM39E]
MEKKKYTVIDKIKVFFYVIWKSIKFIFDVIMWLPAKIFMYL